MKRSRLAILVCAAVLLRSLALLEAWLYYLYGESASPVSIELMRLTAENFPELQKPFNAAQDAYASSQCCRRLEPYVCRGDLWRELPPKPFMEGRPVVGVVGRFAQAL